jgi:hypothetical protein
MNPAINPYIDLPLPIGTRIDFGFKPSTPASRVEEKITMDEAVREVNRAMHKLAFEGEIE